MNILEQLSKVEIGDWVQTLGGVFGALLAGMISIMIFQKQVKVTREDQKAKEIENFLKTYHPLKDWVTEGIGAIEATEDIVNDEELNEEARLYVLEFEESTFKTILEKLNSINHDYILYGSYKRYLEIKGICSDLTPKLKLQVDLFKSHKRVFWREHISAQATALRQILNELDVYATKIEKELNAIKRKQKGA